MSDQPPTNTIPYQAHAQALAATLAQCGEMIERAVAGAAKKHGDQVHDLTRQAAGLEAQLAEARRIQERQKAELDRLDALANSRQDEIEDLVSDLDAAEAKLERAAHEAKKAAKASSEDGNAWQAHAEKLASKLGNLESKHAALTRDNQRALVNLENARSERDHWIEKAMELEEERNRLQAMASKHLLRAKAAEAALEALDHKPVGDLKKGRN